MSETSRARAVSGVLLALLCGVAFSAPALLAIDTSSRILAPGSTLEALLSDADADIAELPTSGRYLLWLVDAFFALEERTEVPGAELNPQQGGDWTVPNPTSLLPDIAPEASYVIFYERAGFLPLRDEHRAVQERIQPARALFDDIGAIPLTYQSGMYRLDTPLADLYLMEGRTIVGYYGGISAFREVGLVEALREDVRAFLGGATPRLAQLAYRHPGSELPLDPDFAAPALLLRMSDNALDAPPDGIRTNPYEVTHPGATNRFLLETLPAILELYGVSGIVLLEDTARLMEMAEAFPDWAFLPADTPEAGVLWFGLQGVVVDGCRRVVAPFMLFAAPPDEEDTAPLERALMQASEALCEASSP